MIVIIMGVSGSGKSTIGALLAHALGWHFADADSFHPPSNVLKMSQGIALTEEDRAPWLTSIRGQIERWMTEPRSVVLACSALRASHRQVLMVDPLRMRLVYLKGSLDVLQTRLANRRHHFMPAELLDSQLAILDEPIDAIAVDINQPPEAIVRQVRHALTAPAST